MKDRITFSLPACWTALSQEELKFLYAMMVLYSDRSDAWRHIATRLILRRAGVHDLYPYGSRYRAVIDGQEVEIYPQEMAMFIDMLSWISEIPEEPVRLDTIEGASAMSPDPTPELTFSEWIAIDNLFQGYQFTQDPNLLTEMARILYRSETLEPAPAERISVFYWMASVKRMVAARYPHFFRPAPVNGQPEMPDADELRRSVDAQIRALTKGDVTKEDQVLAIQADRALAELDALAREYEELNRKYPPKNA